MTGWGKRKDGQAYPIRKKSRTKRKGSILSSGKKLSIANEGDGAWERSSASFFFQIREHLWSLKDPAVVKSEVKNIVTDLESKKREQTDRSEIRALDWIITGIIDIGNDQVKKLNKSQKPKSWKKMSIKEKQYALHDVGIPILDDHDYLHLDDFDDLPKGIRNALRKKLGIEEE